MTDIAARRETLARRLLATGTLTGDQIRRLVGDHDLNRLLDFYWFSRSKACIGLSDMGRLAVAELRRQELQRQVDGGPPRKCSKCGDRKPVGDFPIAIAKGHAYVRGICKACLTDDSTTRSAVRPARNDGKAQ